MVFPAPCTLSRRLDRPVLAQEWRKRIFGLRLTGNSLDGKGEEECGTHLSSLPCATCHLQATSLRGLVLGAFAKHPQLSWLLKGPRKGEPACWCQCGMGTGVCPPGGSRCSAKTREVDAREETVSQLLWASPVRWFLRVAGATGSPAGSSRDVWPQAVRWGIRALPGLESRPACSSLKLLRS